MGYSGDFLPEENKENVGVIIFVIIVGFLLVVMLFAGFMALSVRTAGQVVDATVTAPKATQTVHSATATRTLEPTATPEINFSLGDRENFPRELINDPFDDNHYDWPVDEDGNEHEGDYAKSIEQIAGGVYRIEAEAKDGFIGWRYPYMVEVEDFSLEVDLQMVEGNSYAEYGVVFRVDNDNFYTFYLDGNGRFYINILYWDDWTTLDSGRFTGLKEGMNTLRVAAQGDEFFFFINDIQVAEIEDARIPSGDVGIIYGLAREGDYGVFEFDNFILRTSDGELPIASTTRTPGVVSLEASDDLSVYIDPDDYSDVVILDTFENNDNIWNLGKINNLWGNINSSISDGALRIEVQADQRFIHDFSPYLVDHYPDDFYLSFDTQFPQKAIGEIGVTFRSDLHNSYLFTLKPSGEFEFWIRYKGDWEYLDGGWVSEVSSQPTKTYTITIVAIEDQFFFFLDGKYLDQIQDDRLTTGKIALIILLDEGGEGAFWFDNFELRRP